MGDAAPALLPPRTFQPHGPEGTAIYHHRRNFTALLRSSLTSHKFSGRGTHDNGTQVLCHWATQGANPWRDSNPQSPPHWGEVTAVFTTGLKLKSSCSNYVPIMALPFREQAVTARARAPWGFEPHSPKAALPIEVSVAYHHWPN